MEWTREKTLILIEEYKKRRGLWDMTHEDYRKKDMKKELLDQVSQKFDKAISTVEIEKKFHTLRTQYHREISRMLNQNLKTNQPYKSKWFAFQHLQFLSSPKACRNMKGLKISNKSNKSPQSSTSSTPVTSKTIRIPVTVANIKNLEGPPTKIFIKSAGTKSDSDSQHAIEAAIKCITTHKKSNSDDENDESQCEILEHDATEDNDCDGDCSERAQRGRHSNNSSTNSKTQIEFIDTGKQLEKLFADTVKNVEEQTESKVIIKEINVPLHTLQPGSEHTTTYEIAETHEKLESTHDSEVMVDISEHNDDPIGEGEHEHCYSGHQQQENHSHIHHQQQSHQQQHQNHHHQQHSELRTIKLPSKKRDFYERLLYEVEDPPQEFEKKNSFIASSTPRDEYSVYGEYIANELRNITSRDLIIQLKHKINTALYEAGLAQLHKEY